MKKLLVSMLLLSSAAVLWAGGQSHRYDKIPLLEDEVARAVAEQQAAPAWYAQLKTIQKAYAQHPNGAPSGVPLLPHKVISQQQEEIYNQRMAQLQKSINANKHLKGLSLVAPAPNDLAELSLDNYGALHAFLRGLPFAKVLHTERVRPFTLAVQIKGEGQGAVEVWIDVPTHNVYLMSDNLNTTAAGKYGMLL